MPKKYNNRACSDLHYAAEKGDLESVKQSLAGGGNPNYQEGKYTVLQIAVINNHLSVVEYLLKNGAKPNMKSKEQLTPLMQASTDDMVKLLARYKADPYITDGRRNNALIYFALYGNLEAVKAWMDLEWLLPRNFNRLCNKLLAACRFEMLEAITGFRFTTQTSFARIAEFKLRYKRDIKTDVRVS
ncbi:MAG: ankyrin repeat domain-containing protein [Negativicutes bacterium]|nr:ankyrin repeat domain-containing protein [Negativicutes bacterium]